MNKPKPQDSLELHLEQNSIHPDSDLDMREFFHEISIAEIIYAARKAAGLT